MMIRGNILALALAMSTTSVMVSGAGHMSQEACQDIAMLGVPNWDRFEGTLEIEVDDDCMFTLEAKLKHDPSIPVPDDPATQCDPSISPPAIASDGMPYFAFRWHYLDASDEIKSITGIDHISYDFNPCGHPPMGVWTAPHYDMHTYRVTKEFRTCMTCDLLPGTPICDFNSGMQTTAEGLKFFEPVTKDIPTGFLVRPGDNIPVMGGHAWLNQPDSAMNWSEPSLITGYYDNEFLYYEPMPPLGFVTGDTDKFWEVDITYENQTIPELANYMSVSYNATTGFATYTYKGPSKVCNSDDSPTKAPTTDSDDKSGAQTWGLMVSMVAAVASFFVN